MYNDIPEVIISVSLSAPKASVFSDLVKYILVVATPVQVYLLAFVWEADLSLLKIESTSFSVPSDSVTMLKVAGSQCGRIFMGGNDGNVYELEYQNAEVWSVFGSSRKCRKLNHTAWHWKLIHIVPSIFRELSGWNDSIFDIVVDDQRGLLFSISSKGDLSAFFLGHKKDSLIAIRTHFNIFEEAYHCVLNKPMDFSPKADYLKSGSMKIIGIFVVPVTESRQIHLLLVLSTGIRVYVAVKASDGSHFYREGSEAPPSDLRVIHVRSPPPPEAIVAAASLHAGGVRETSFLPTYLPSQPLSLHTAYYNHGVLLAAMGSENSADKVLGLSDDSKGQLFKEGIAIVAEEGHSNRVYDIREVCHSIHKKEELLLHAGFVISRSSNALADPSSNLLNLFPGCGAPGLALSSTAGSVPGSIVPFPESILQMAPSQGPSRRKLLCLLNGGLLQVNKNRPIDILYRMLETSSQSEEFVDQARAVFLHYGILPSATMCVAIACNSPLDLQAERVEADTNAPDANLGLVQRRALTVLQRLGEPTSFRVSGLIPAVQQDSRFSMSGTTGFVMSTSHDALQLFLSRTLRPLWLKTIVTKSGTLSSLFAPRGIIGAIRMPLINFAAILVNYFGSAIRLDVSSAEQKKRDDDGASSLLVRQLQLQHSHQNNTPSAAAGAAPADQEKALLREAKRREDASILAMYRLATRSIHALSLLDILISGNCNVTAHN